MKKIQPLDDRVVIGPIDVTEVGETSSGIIIPETVDKEAPNQGKVIAVGPGRWNEDGDGRIKMSVKEGDTVIFSKYGHDEVKQDGKEYYIVSEGNILAVVA